MNKLVERAIEEDKIKSYKDFCKTVESNNYKLSDDEVAYYKKLLKRNKVKCVISKIALALMLLIIVCGLLFFTLIGLIAYNVGNTGLGVTLLVYVGINVAVILFTFIHELCS